MSIVKRDGVNLHQDFSFPIDSSIFDFDLVIYGDISKATLTDHLGKVLHTLSMTEKKS